MKETQRAGGCRQACSSTPARTLQRRLTQHISRRMVRGCLKKATGSKLMLPALAAPYAPADSIPSAALCCPTAADRRR